MSSKHFIDDPEHLVNSALNAITLTNPGVGIDSLNKIVYVRPRHEPTQQKVAIISGGGSGHEPAFASMVGPGMLSAAVVGHIFASPNAEQVRTAIMSRVSHNDCAKQKANAYDEGVLLVIMNYTGDVLSFGVAVEKARAAGINVEMVVVGDDVAIGRSKAGKVGRRGIAGTVLVQKLSGALAAMGYGIRQVTELARLFADNVASIGASLEHVHVPGLTKNSTKGLAELRAGEVEIGMGIHNEQGTDRVKATLPELIENMLAQLLKQSDPDRSFVDFSQCSTNIVLLVNNLGGLSTLELAGITNEVVLQLDKAYNIQPLRVLSGTYMTSLNAPGFSISLLRIIDTGIDAVSMLDLLDYPCEVSGWTCPIKRTTWEAKDLGVRDSEVSTLSDEPRSNLIIDVNLFQEALTTGLENLIAAEPLITHYDTIVGDGDCGVCLKRGARGNLSRFYDC
ncbi:dihydroxyacetone kinase [Trichoderma arundinaceum]|uniref:Dihydroxyacetone kinase n=1 Tax=Trichoderma arundinaceum TaxID=490622 RepID=A0A395NX12_TRIAR|nr:dihydroxyacetone kinase [Trichoderma arundinaceum]